MRLPGWATPEGTRAYRDRFSGRAVAGHFREHNGWWLASLGIGTYLGEHDAATDEQYRQSVARALERGVNVIDTAINYRFQRSERSIGAALGALVEQGTVAREEIVVASKAGFLSFDGEVPADPRAYFMEEYVSRGIVKPEEVVGGMHCLAPRYLEDQIERSRRNLRLETVDIYYLHNPETQLQAVPRAEFLRRMRAAFETLEAAVAAGKIRCYGLATWTGFRGPPAGRDSLGLQELVKLAEQVAGPEHHFKVVQLPYNLAMPEAFALRNQPLAGETVSVLEAARRLGLTVFASASIMQGQVAVNLPAELRAQLNGGLDTDAQRGLQFVRSTPGIGAALVGMRRLEHVEENLRLVGRALATPEAIRQLFSA